MPIEPGVIDTNVLVYAVNEDSPHVAAARSLLGAALEPDTELFVTSQILCEFYSIVTNPKRIPSAASAEDAIGMLADLLDLPGLSVLNAPKEVALRLLVLLRRQRVTRSGIFDLQIVATMQANSINRIYTFNVADFVRFPELVVSVPIEARNNSVT